MEGGEGVEHFSLCLFMAFRIQSGFCLKFLSSVVVWHSWGMHVNLPLSSKEVGERERERVKERAIAWRIFKIQFMLSRDIQIFWYLIWRVEEYIKHNPLSSSLAVSCLAIAAAAGLPGPVAGQDITSQPNILMIVADDLGKLNLILIWLCKYIYIYLYIYWYIYIYI